jgi:2-polyprenyl-3-methyl-5-hydroxy-6-metoxy-1,4-benzoquinol methylase
MGKWPTATAPSLVFLNRNIYLCRYYSKRPSIRDPRLALLPAEFFMGKRVLDVGCNEGWVTCEIGGPPL